MVETEPTRLVSLTNAALVATLGVLIALDVIPENVASAVSVALGAWVLLAGEFLRDRVTPVGHATLTEEQVKTMTVCDTPDNGETT